MHSKAERRAMERLRQAGASVFITRGGAVKVECDLRGQPLTRGHLEALAALGNLEELDLYGARIADDLLAALRLPTLKGLNLNCAAITERGLSRIPSLASLEFLELMETEASDECLEAIVQCRQLARLRIDGTAISPTGVAQLCGRLPLRVLWIDGRQATGPCLASLATAGSLDELNLVGADVTDRTMGLVPALPSLRRIGLVRTSVTDGGLVHLRAAGNLEAICLSNSERLTDTAVDHLQGFGRLRSLWLVGTRITGAGMAQLRTWYPQATIGPEENKGEK
ncbi:MAG: hypothetical protein RBS80_20360 [Thermoguttaceae bacterium]|jgi:hypothetical protein|nr:hypothetical protein [Thermoguttaceae bacterium]